VRLLRLMVTAAALVGAAAPHARAGSCPLPLDSQLKAMRAFVPIHKFVMNEPRCVNCHGGVNPHLDEPGPDPDDPNAVASTVAHGPGAIGRFETPDANGVRRTMEVSCIGCHDGMAPRRDGSTSRWFTAPPFLAFLNKDAPTLCKQFKRATGSAEHFLGHLQDDNGGNAFTATAFLGNRGVESLAPIPPSISHAAFTRMGREWIDALGGEFKGDESCGCEPKLNGKFTSLDSSAMDSVRISGDLTWKLEPQADAAPGAPLVFKPESGDITVELRYNTPGIASHCEALGRRTFSVDRMARGALRFMKLELQDDGSYQVTLVIPDHPDPFPTWELEGKCVFPNVTAAAPSPVKFMSMVLGTQRGTAQSGAEIQGELETPIRQGPRTTTGSWSFTAEK
jgi:hypothetical protein